MRQKTVGIIGGMGPEAEVVLIACTELSIIARRLRIGVRAYDSAQVLAEAIVATALRDETCVTR